MNQLIMNGVTAQRIKTDMNDMNKDMRTPTDTYSGKLLHTQIDAITENKFREFFNEWIWVNGNFPDTWPIYKIEDKALTVGDFKKLLGID